MLDYKKKQAVIIKATKDLVDELLSINTNNRNIKKTHKQWLERSINNGEFILTGQGIAVSSTGILVDGQHRLSAIREAGYPPVELLVVTGLDEKAMQYVDMHAKRTSADMLRLVLNKGVTTRMASIINTHLKLAENTDGFNYVKGRPSLEQFVEQMDKHSDFLELLISAGGTLPRAGTYCALFHYGLKYGEDRALALAEKIKDGENLSKNDPAYKLRQILLGGNRRTTYGSAGQLADYRVTVTVCVADSRDEKIDILRPSDTWNSKLAKVA